MPSNEHQATAGQSGTTERYEIFLKAALALGSASSVVEALDIVSGALLRTINFDSVVLFLSRGAPVADHEWYRLSRNTDHSGFEVQRDPPVESEIGLLAFERNAQARQAGVPTMCAVPLTTPRGLIGSITFCSNQLDAYPEDEVRFLALVGAHVGLVLLSLIDQADVPGTNRLKVILEINNSIASNLDLYDLLRAVSGSVRNVLRGDAAAVSIPEGDHLRVYTLDFPGAVGAAREGVLIPIKESMLGEVSSPVRPPGTTYPSNLRSRWRPTNA